MFDLNEYIKTLEHLVNIDSGSYNITGVNRIADYMKSLFNDLGWHITRHHISGQVGDCLEIVNHTADYYDVMFIAHMDTVFPDGEAARRPISIENGIVHGPGSCDCKGGLAQAYYIAKLMPHRLNEMLNICILFNGDEEISSIGSRPIIEKIARKTGCAFVLEPAQPDGKHICQRKGLAKYQVEFYGKAAHAGVNPQDGASAVHELGRWICDAVSLGDLAIGTTINVGVVEGGTVANVVAARATAKIDVRVWTMDELSRVEMGMQKLVEQSKKRNVRVNVEQLGYRPPMIYTEKAQMFYEHMKRVGTSMGINVEVDKRGGGSDGNFIAGVGTICMDGMGPVGGKGHSIDEYLQLDSVKGSIEYIHALMEDLALKKGEEE